jgi:hypothetical protein
LTGAQQHQRIANFGLSKVTRLTAEPSAEATLPAAIYRFLIFSGVSASHGGGSAFFIEITAIHTDSQAVDSAIVLLLLRDKGREIGRMLP